MGVVTPREVEPARNFPPAADAHGNFIAWLLGAICTIALIASLYFTRAIDPLNSDTPSYLYFDPSRTIGYPAFLWIMKVLTGSARSAVEAQMALLAGSLFLLGWSFQKLVRNWKLTLLFQILLVASPELWHSSADLMTEGLATACVALWCAQLLRLVRSASLAGLLVLALIAAAATLVRPSLVTLFAGSLAAALLLKVGRERWFALLVLIPIAVAAWFATPVASLLIRGSAVTTSPFARGVLQHTLFCDQPTAPRDPDSAFVEAQSKLVRHYVNAAPGDVRTGLEHVYSAEMRFRSIIPAIGRAHHLTAAWQTDRVIGRIARQRVEANPICYASDVLESYLGLLTQGSAHSKAVARRVNAYIAANPPPWISPQPLLLEDARALSRTAAELEVAPPPAAGPPHISSTASPALLIVGRILYGCASAIGLISLVALIAWRRMSSNAQRLAACLAALGAALHAMFAGTAIVELALIRYTVPAWPIICAILALAFTRLAPAVTGGFAGLEVPGQPQLPQ